MDSKRSHYRVPQRQGAMRVTLCAADGSVEGRVLDLSIQGSGAAFPVQGMPAVMPGDRVRLEFRTLLLIEALATEAVVRRIDAVRGELRVGLEFTDPRAVLRDVPYVLRPYFNRRRHPRAEIDEPVAVELVSPARTLQGWLRQLGVGGAMVALPREPAVALARRERVELRFDFPGEERKFWLLAVVRGLWQDGEALGCSLRFDRLGTVDFQRQREAIAALLAARDAQAPRPEGSGAP